MPYILSYNTSIKPLEPDRILAEMWTFQRDLFRRITEHIRYAVFFYVLQKAAKAGEGGDTVMTQTFMKEKKILPLVLSMSLPMVISMAVNSLYNIVDSYFVA